jgi:hypothetical protein
MRELKALGDGHLNLRFSEWKEFFEVQMGEQVRCQVKRMIEQALKGERNYYLQLGYYEHSPQCRLDYSNGYPTSWACSSLTNGQATRMTDRQSFTAKAGTLDSEPR